MTYIVHLHRLVWISECLLCIPIIITTFTIREHLGVVTNRYPNQNCYSLFKGFLKWNIRPLVCWSAQNAVLSILSLWSSVKRDNMGVIKFIKLGILQLSGVNANSSALQDHSSRPCQLAKTYRGVADPGNGLCQIRVEQIYCQRFFFLSHFNRKIISIRPEENIHKKIVINTD